MEYSTLERWQGISETGIIYDQGSLYARFEQLRDPRKARGKRYSLVTLLVIIFLGKLCGQDRPVEIADWARNHAEEIVELLQLPRKWMPHHNTIRRVYQNILTEAEFDQMAQEYSQQEHAGRREVLALDGKTLRGTGISGHKEHDHILSLYGVESQHVLAQAKVDRKENEITAAPRVLEQVDVSGKVVTGDALLAQRTISGQIIAQKGDFIWPIKDNHPRLLSDIEKLFAAPDEVPKPGFGKIGTDFQRTSTVNKGHGRIEKRTLQTSTMLNEYLDWPGLAQVYRLERKFAWLRQGQVTKRSCETEYGITSLPRSQASPADLLQFRRQHWFIETGLHYRRDVTFKEDATRATQASAGRILATIHNLVIALIKRAGYTNAAKARRRFAGRLDLAFALLTTTTSRL
jgi:predicted transposase YbfD/YdcC